MRRRTFLAAGAAALVCPTGGRAQQPAVPVIGFLNSQSAPSFVQYEAAFRRGLKERGYVEGQNLAIEFRWAEGRYDRLPDMAADLVRRRVALIVATGGPAPVLAAKAATTEIPIVFSTGGDAIERGIVKSLNRPGGNITGYNFLTADLSAKRLGLLHDMVPNARRVILLLNPANSGSLPQQAAIEAAAGKLGLSVTVLRAESDGDVTSLPATAARGDAAIMVVAADPFLLTQRERIVNFAAETRLPAIYELREFVAIGGLMSYGASLDDDYRQVGVYAARVLNGEKPGGLPIIQPTKFDLTVNLKTARTLGLTVPQMLLAQADEVVE